MQSIKPSILHLLTTAKNASPFDVNMAIDAGFDKVMPYTNLELAEVAGLAQDAIFSRSPSGVKREALFIGGRDIDLAIAMMVAAKNTMFHPFACSIFADPSGAFTTGAAIVAKLEWHLKQQFDQALAGKTLCIFGANGPVGGCVAIIAAQLGTQVQLVTHKSVSTLTEKVARWNSKYQLSMQVKDGTTEQAKEQALEQAELLVCAAAAGVRLISQSQLQQAKNLKGLVDVNAVPPSAVDGVSSDMDGQLILSDRAFAVGALGVGQLKYQTQMRLLKQMTTADQPLYLEFNAAFKLARDILHTY
jgi:methylene-tetrahydromethanopterin dehydrogenase